MMKLSTVVISVFALVTSSAAYSQEQRTDRYEVEGGVLDTRNMEIHGYEQGNATKDWHSTDPTARFEYWSTKESAWNYGIVAQPLYTRYSDTLQSDLNNDGKVYKKGDHGSLDYQFHSLRGSANYPVLGSEIEKSYLRLGGTLIARYADVNFRTDSDSFHDRNFIAFPLVNFESEVSITSDYGIFTRGDFLPSIDGNLFLDGLFDVLLAARRHLCDGSSLDVGVRLFFGGYDPKKVDDYANRIFFNGGVVRYSW